MAEAASRPAPPDAPLAALEAAFAAARALSPEPPAPAPAPPPAPRKSPTTRLVDLALALGTPQHTPDGRLLLALPTPRWRRREVVLLDAREGAEWLADLAYTTTGHAPRMGAVYDALHVLRGLARRGVPRRRLVPERLRGAVPLGRRRKG
jgi:hypothetical protein